MDPNEEKVIKIDEFHSVICLDAATDEDIKALKEKINNHVIADSNIHILEGNDAGLSAWQKIHSVALTAFIDANPNKFKLEDNKQDNK